MLLAAHHALLGHGHAVAAIRSSAKGRHSSAMHPLGLSRYPCRIRPKTSRIAYAESCSLTHATLWNMAWWLDPVVLGRYPANSARNLRRRRAESCGR